MNPNKTLDDILYDLESEYMNAYQRVTKGKDTGIELARNNLESSEKAKADIKALFLELIINYDMYEYDPEAGRYRSLELIKAVEAL